MRSISSSKGIDMASSTTQGLFTWPEIANSLVPALFGRPKPANHSAPAAQDGRHHGDGFHVVHRRRAAIKPRARREGRLHARHALLALEAFQKRRFLAADIGPRAMMQVEVEIPARPGGVLAQKPRVIGLVDGGLQRLALADVFAADVDVAGMRAHREGGDQAALDQRVGIVAHDLPVLAGAGLGFVGVDHEVGGPPVRFLRHEGPLEAGGKAAPPRPRKPLAFMISTILSRPRPIRSFVPSQCPRALAPASVRSCIP
jgi:hypothetical protein